MINNHLVIFKAKALAIFKAKACSLLMYVLCHDA